MTYAYYCDDYTNERIARISHSDCCYYYFHYNGSRMFLENKKCTGYIRIYEYVLCI